MIKKKTKILLILSILIYTLNISSVYADANIGWATYTPSYQGSSGSNNNTAPGPNGHMSYTPTGSDITYSCEYYYSISPSTQITMNSYDLSNNSLMNGSTTIYNTFTSGTWIGLRNQETRSVSWIIDSSTFKCYRATYNYTCNYTCTSSSLKPSTKYSNATLPSCGDCQDIGDAGCAFGVGCYRKCRCSTTINIPQTNTETQQQIYTNQTSNNCPSNYNNIPTCIFTEKTKESEGERIEVTDSSIINTALNKARNDVKTEARNYIGAPTTIVKMIDLNEYPKNGNISSSNEKELPYVKGNFIDNSSTYSGTMSQIYTYQPNKVCLNVKTGAVRYIITGNIGCNTDEFDVTTGIGKDGKTYWKYFIPLNSKTGSKFYIKVEKGNNTQNLNVEECNSVVKNYPIKSSYIYHIKRKNGTTLQGNFQVDKRNIESDNGCRNTKNQTLSAANCITIMTQYPMNNDYTNYIKQLNGNNFKGNYNIVNNPNANSSDKSAIINQGGCKFSTSVNFEVIQKFYGEETQNKYTSLKGYGVHFRQIDINNPFPSGVSNSTYWSNLYTASNNSVKVGNKNIKLSNSYVGSNLTYVASNVSSSKVSSYNSKYPYTSWDDMYINGTSKFISSENIVSRKINLNSYYKLGCGPSNATWGGCK